MRRLGAKAASLWEGLWAEEITGGQMSSLGSKARAAQTERRGHLEGFLLDWTSISTGAKSARSTVAALLLL